MPPFATAYMSRISGLMAVLFATLVLSGCVSSSSNTATYGGPSVASTTAELRSARRDTRQAQRDVRKAEREQKAIERRIARAERRLKRKLSKTRKDNLKKAIRADRKALRKARRDVRKARRSAARKARDERKAGRKVADARKRVQEAEKRLAADKKRKAEERAKQQAQQALARDNSSQSSSYAARLFGRSDPALKNISDYRARVDNAFPVVAVPVEKLDKRFLRQEVAYRSRHKPGTVVVDPHSRFLYLVMSGNRAMRYGIGVGRQGFEWKGNAYIGWKQKWPKWTPPEEMIQRQPELAKWGVDNGGMPGGPKNPLGARALYLFQDGKDTLYRLHGTPQWASIGTAASSGCIRLMNQDVIDLYNRVPNGAKVVVL